MKNYTHLLLIHLFGLKKINAEKDAQLLFTQRLKLGRYFYDMQ